MQIFIKTELLVRRGGAKNRRRRKKEWYSIKRQNLTEKEFLFCCYFAELSSVLDSAVNAGFEKENAFYEGVKILQKPEALRQIRKQRKILFGKGESSAAAALRRIIFSNPVEAVNSVMTDEPCEKGDFFSISEIKRAKGGGTELKLLNKLEALKLLFEIEENEKKSNGAQSFFSALSQGISSVKGEDDGV